MKKSIVYTKTGDKGTTSLIGGTRVSKTDDRLEAYGTIDELNAQLGLLVTYLTVEEDREFVVWIQNRLFSVGGYLATDQEKVTVKDIITISGEDVERIEHEIDRIDEMLPPLRAFVIPGGGRGAAVCHVCRTVCRRSERRALSLCQQYKVSEEILTFLNRLSDYLFVLSRLMNVIEKRDEIFWNNSCK